MSRPGLNIRKIFSFTEEDFNSAMAMSRVLVQDLVFRLGIELVLAALFLWAGRPVLAGFWLLAIIPSELAEVILCNAMQKVDRARPSHLYFQFAVSICGGTSWAACGAYLWSTEETALMAAGLLMIVGVAMHVAFKYSDWLKGAAVAAIPPMLALIALAVMPNTFAANLAERLLVIFGIAGLIYYMFIVAAGNFAKQRQLRQAWMAASEASEAKSTFLATMSHEIRTPMNGVLGMAELLDRSDLNERQAEMVKIIRSSGDTLIGVIDDILDLAKIEAGHEALDPHPFSLNDLVRTVIVTSEMSAHAKGLSFSVFRNNEHDLQLVGDALRLRQIIGNLVSNAIKFTSEGEVRLEVLTRTDELSDSCHLTLRVIDSGPGLTPDEQARIFNPFIQGDGSATRRHGGTGLGLSIAAHFAELMQGRLQVFSRRGEGATFTFSCDLPFASLVHQAQTEEVSKASSTQLLRADERPPRVLVAEDHPFNRRVLAMMLDAMEVDLQFAIDGQQAVEACRDERFDIILMDIQMPGVSGVEALKLIRAQEAEDQLEPVPIIALTANAMKHQVAEYIAAGFDGHLPKPVSIEALYNTLTGCLRRPAGGK